MNMTSTVTLSFPGLPARNIKAISSELPWGEFLSTPGKTLLRFSWLNLELWGNVKKVLKDYHYETHERLNGIEYPLPPAAPEDRVTILNGRVSCESVEPHFGNNFIFLEKTQREWILLRIYENRVYIGYATFPTGWLLVLTYDDFMRNFLHTPGRDSASKIESIYTYLKQGWEAYLPVWDVVEFHPNVSAHDLSIMLNWRWTEHIST